MFWRQIKNKNFFLTLFDSDFRRNAAGKAALISCGESGTGHRVTMSGGRRSVGKRIRMYNEESYAADDANYDNSNNDDSGGGSEQDSSYDPMAYYRQQQQEMLLQVWWHKSL